MRKNYTKPKWPFDKIVACTSYSYHKPDPPSESFTIDEWEKFARSQGRYIVKIEADLRQRNSERSELRRALNPFII